MKRFKVTINNPAGETYSYYWEDEQVHNFTKIPAYDLLEISYIKVVNEDGSGYVVEENK
jgi:hypothetical protein